MKRFIAVWRELRRFRSSEDTIMQAPMSMREAAETLDGGRTRIYELIAAGWSQTFIIGGRRYVTRDSFERMIEAAQNGVGVLVFVEDVDAHCERARAAGAEIIESPKDQPFGDRIYLAKDCDGHEWNFAPARSRRIH
jgi:hypothetical protein